MRRLLTLGLVCGGLAACTVPSPFEGKVPAIPAPPGNLAADREACNQQFPPRIGNYLPHAQCVNTAVENDAIPFARYPDLVRLQEQLRIKYSTQIDQHVISPQKGERKMTEADKLVNATIRDRDRGRRVVAEHRVEALKAMLE
jgi:hypothetical protein